MNNYELIESYVKKGESRNIMSALTLLTEAYIDQCGVSLGGWLWRLFGKMFKILCRRQSCC